MTTNHTPPEDAFDRWLDALSDGDHVPIADERAEIAASLHRQLGMPPVTGAGLPSDTRAAIRERVFADRTRAEVPVTDTPGAEPRIIPAERRRPARRAASLAAAAVLALLAAATIAAFLRLDDGDRSGGIGATASMLPFAPSAALASPTPAAACATDDTLLLMPEEPVTPGAFADLPFPVAWYAGGTLTVERTGEVLREIEIGEADYVRPTAVSGVVLATSYEPAATREHARLANIATGETAELGPYHHFVVTDGPYVLWASDASYTRWSVTDLRTFQTVDLSERFPIEPLVSWRPYSSALTTSTDGAVMLIGTTSYSPVNATVAPATPITSEGPPLDISNDALLINGSVDDIRVVGPRAVASGAMALSPDGATAAWLAPSDQAGQRILTIVNVAGGEVIAERPIDATYSNSLLFSADGATLFATHGTVLETIPVRAVAGTPAATPDPIDLPDTGFRILAASPDHTKLLLAGTTYAAGETSLWVNLTTGETREIDGTPGRMFTGQVPAVSGPINRYVLLDDIEETVRVVDMTTGEIVLDEARGDAVLVTVSPDGSTLLVPREDGIEIRALATGQSTFHPAPTGAEPIPPTTFALSSAGACAAGSWDLVGEAIESVLLPTGSDEPIELPTSGVGGWVPSDQQD